MQKQKENNNKNMQGAQDGGRGRTVWWELSEIVDFEILSEKRFYTSEFPFQKKLALSEV